MNSPQSINSDVATINTILPILVDGLNLDQTQSHDFFQQVLQGNVNPALMASVLTALKIKGETPEEIKGLQAHFRNCDCSG